MSQETTENAELVDLAAGIFAIDAEFNRAPPGYIEIQACDSMKLFESDEHAADYLCICFGGSPIVTKVGGYTVVGVPQQTALNAGLIKPDEIR